MHDRGWRSEISQHQFPKPAECRFFLPSGLEWIVRYTLESSARTVQVVRVLFRRGLSVAGCFASNGNNVAAKLRLKRITAASTPAVYRMKCNGIVHEPDVYSFPMEIRAYAQLASFVDQLLDTICVVDTEGRFVFVSAASERIFGYTPDEMIGKPMIDFVFHEDRARTLTQVDRIVGGYLQHHFENRYLRKDGQVVHVMWSARWSATDQLRIAVARDVTALKQAESLQQALYAISEAAHAAEDLLDLFRRIHQIIGKLLPAVNFSVALCDARNGELTFPYDVDQCDPGSALTQRVAASLFAELVRTGQPLLLTPETMASFSGNIPNLGGMSALCWLAAPLHAQKGCIGALFLRSPREGAHYTEKDKELLQFVSTQVATAIERKQLLAKLQYTAQYDELTDLPNRRLLHERLERALARLRRELGGMSLLYLDLDKFKQINDCFGHAAGDLVLQEVARRLKQCVREVDTVARIGGDEFVILLEDAQPPELATMMAQRIRSVLNRPINIEGQSVSIIPSIGVARYPEHGLVAQQLLKHADEAMYLSKNDGDSRFCHGVEWNDSDVNAPMKVVAGNVWVSGHTENMPALCVVSETSQAQAKPKD